MIKILRNKLIKTKKKLINLGENDSLINASEEDTTKKVFCPFFVLDFMIMIFLA